MNNTIKIIKLIIIIFIMSLAFNKTAIADDDSSESFKNWHFYVDEKEDSKICYIYSVPQDSQGNYRERNNPYFLVKNIENSNPEITISSGFMYKKSSEVEISLKNKKFNIFTFENLAWAYNMNQDLDIIKEIKKNNFLEIYAINKYGRYAKDSYSLEGFDLAYNKIVQFCNK